MRIPGTREARARNKEGSKGRQCSRDLLQMSPKTSREIIRQLGLAQKVKDSSLTPRRGLLLAWCSTFGATKSALSGGRRRLQTRIGSSFYHPLDTAGILTSMSVVKTGYGRVRVPQSPGKACHISP